MRRCSVGHLDGRTLAQCAAGLDLLTQVIVIEDVEFLHARRAIRRGFEYRVAQRSEIAASGPGQGGHRQAETPGRLRGPALQELIPFP